MVGSKHSATGTPECPSYGLFTSGPSQIPRLQYLIEVHLATDVGIEH